VRDAVEYFKDCLEIPIALDPSLPGAAADATLDFHGIMPSGPALQIMLHQIGLAPVVRNETLVITTLEGARKDAIASGKE
jgi:hypothetical protein